MPVLLERDGALADLDGLVGQAVRAAGQVVLLSGEAGVGKTALIGGFLSRLDASVRVVRGYCDALATPRPLGPLIDMLPALPSAAIPGLAAAIKTGETESIYSRLLRVFADGNRWVAVIEDAHWADGATLDLLRFLSRRISALPVLLIVSYRDNELGEEHPLAAALGDLVSYPTLTRIGLNPLSIDGVGRLAAGSGVNAAELHRLTGGNPFFATEILAVGPGGLRDAELPRSITEAVRGRLAKLSAAARDAAHCAAVCGPRAAPGLLDNVCPGAAKALPECLDAGVLVADGDVVGFRHELARRAAAEQIAEYQRRELHARALAALAEPPIDDNALGALAFHAEQAGDEVAVLRYGIAGAERATVLGANREAAELYALALGHADAVAVEQKVEWLEGHAFTSYLCGQSEMAIRSWRDAIALRHKFGDRLRESDNLRWLSHCLWPMGRTAEAADAAHASLALVEHGDPCSELAWSLVNLAELAAFGYDPRCADYAARAIALGEQLHDRAVVIRGRGHAALATVFGTDGGWEQLEAAWRDAMESDGLAEHAGLLGAIMCWTAALHHDLDRADRYIDETAAFCREHDLGAFEPPAVGAQALIALYRGDWHRAGAFADDLLTRPWLLPLHRIVPLLTVALIGARRGERTVAPLLDEALAAAGPDDLFRAGAVWAARAETAWLAGEDATARGEAERGLATATSVNADPWLVGQLRRWAHLCGGGAGPNAPVDDITPYRLEIAGDWQAAVQAWTDLGCPYDTAIAQLGGDLPAVQSALETFRQLGARAAARRAQQRLAVLRGRTTYGRRADTRADPHGLTRRQRDILELLAAGYSDTQIAAELFLSPKTVSNHVSAILTKLGVTNRTQAAAYTLQPSSTNANH